MRAHRAALGERQRDVAGTGADGVHLAGEAAGVDVAGAGARVEVSGDLGDRHVAGAGLHLDGAGGLGDADAARAGPQVHGGHTAQGEVARAELAADGDPLRGHDLVVDGAEAAALGVELERRPVDLVRRGRLVTPIPHDAPDVDLLRVARADRDVAGARLDDDLLDRHLLGVAVVQAGLCDVVAANQAGHGDDAEHREQLSWIHDEHATGGRPRDTSGAVTERTLSTW
ncbi:hypothetical protein GCM10023170_068220 [Phytohabitans houttuyneae]|uniref:Uncharacterized protein n=1 Tax=Phytohabitans houttuyneae TaxID=1076126 RepID=A0A6V8KPH6_9ACTN|nr:hypothetical protein Phou_094900 [Phytohabitans houttuyneae]